MCLRFAESKGQSCSKCALVTACRVHSTCGKLQKTPASKLRKRTLAVWKNISETQWNILKKCCITYTYWHKNMGSDGFKSKSDSEELECECEVCVFKFERDNTPNRVLMLPSIPGLSHPWLLGTCVSGILRKVPRCDPPPIFLCSRVHVLAGKREKECEKSPPPQWDGHTSPFSSACCRNHHSMV